MRYLIKLDIQNSSSVILELNDENSPTTVESFLRNLPFSVELNVWGAMKSIHHQLQLMLPKKIPNLQFL